MRTHIAPWAILAASVLLPVVAAAQDQGPARLDNIWNGKSHALPPAEIHAQEKSAGVALDPAQRKSQTDEVEELAKQLLQQTHEGPGAPPAQ